MAECTIRMCRYNVWSTFAKVLAQILTVKHLFDTTPSLLMNTPVIFTSGLVLTGGYSLWEILLYCYRWIRNGRVHHIVITVTCSWSDSGIAMFPVDEFLQSSIVLIWLNSCLCFVTDERTEGLLLIVLLLGRYDSAIVSPRLVNTTNCICACLTLSNGSTYVRRTFWVSLTPL